jgi:hypothetical protein
MKDELLIKMFRAYHFELRPIEHTVSITAATLHRMESPCCE